jgi:hypothetical protein
MRRALSPHRRVIKEGRRVRGVPRYSPPFHP